MGGVVDNTPRRAIQACRRCRKAKTKCEVGPEGEGQPCLRCIHFGSICQYEQVTEEEERKRWSIGVEEHKRIYQVDTLDRAVSQIDDRMDRFTERQSILEEMVAEVLYHVRTGSNDPNGAPDRPHDAGPSRRPWTPAISNKMETHRLGIPTASVSHSRASTPGSSGPMDPIDLPERVFALPMATMRQVSGDPGRSHDMQEPSEAGPSKRSRNERQEVSGWKHHEPRYYEERRVRDVIEKGLILEAEARRLWKIFFAGTHEFVRLWDANRDTFELIRERSPLCFAAVLTAGCSLRDRPRKPSVLYNQLLDELQLLSRVTLFRPVREKEDVMAMHVVGTMGLGTGHQNGIALAHAKRMAMDLDLHLAPERLHRAQEEGRSTEIDVELLRSARIWLNCYLFDHNSRLGHGKPLAEFDEMLPTKAQILGRHPLAADTDAGLVAAVGLVNMRLRIHYHLLSIIKDSGDDLIAMTNLLLADLDAWYASHRGTLPRGSMADKFLELETSLARLLTVSKALKGSDWTQLDSHQIRLAMLGRDAAQACLRSYLDDSAFKRHLKYASPGQAVPGPFAATFLLKIGSSIPGSVSFNQWIKDVSELSVILARDFGAERFAHSLDVMIARLSNATNDSIPPVNGHAGGEEALAPIGTSVNMAFTPPNSGVAGIGDLGTALGNGVDNPAFPSGRGDDWLSGTLFETSDYESDLMRPQGGFDLGSVLSEPLRWADTFSEPILTSHQP